MTENAPAAPAAVYVVVRANCGTYQVRKDNRRGPLVSNHGRRGAEARKRAEQLNARNA